MGIERQKEISNVYELHMYIWKVLSLLPTNLGLRCDLGPKL